MKVISFLLDLLYPPRCAFCHDFLETSREGVCAHCRTGLPKSMKISSVELVEAIAEPARDILETIHMVLERTPPELVADLAQNGIIMAGGGSLIYGFDQLVEKDTGIRTTVVDDALSCAAFGSGKMLMNLNDMQDGMVNLARKRQMKA